ncbi:MAG: tryptophan synthase subunit alpha [Pirellulaceae bacterium]
MNPIDRLFHDLRSRQKKALMPFIAAGDPDLTMTRELLAAFADVGCHLCELGFPYSDPIADGPTIQAAFVRALSAGVKVEKILDCVAHSKQRPPTLAMLSYAIVHRIGADRFAHQAAVAGFAGLIVPDLPVEESKQLSDRCAAENLSLVQLITPTTKPERARRIIEVASGFIYYVSVAGVTGQRSSLPAEIVENLQALRKLTTLPICVGFGISQPEHVQQLAPHCDGLIVGSAIVRRIENGLANHQSQAAIVNDVKSFCRSLLTALSP